MPLKLMYITNNPQVALVAQRYGVERIFVDLETLGKEERQGHLSSVKSHHTINDIRIIAPELKDSEMLVRINPINPQSKDEIDEVIDAGAELIMLPMWKTASDVETFLRFVGGRVKTTLLLETKEAVEALDEVLSLGGFDEIHIGLNDLHLSYGMTFMFELLANGTVEALCNKIKRKGIPYGFGGIARIGKGAVPAEKIIMEHYRLGSTRAILSRSFCKTDEQKSIAEIEAIFQTNMQALRDYERSMKHMSNARFMRNKDEVIACVNDVEAQILKGIKV